MQEKSMSRENGSSKKSVWLSAIFVVILIPAVILLSNKLGDRNYYIAGVVVIILAMVPFFAGFESRRPNAREIVTLAVMCAIAVASRVAFIMIPNFKPLVGIVMITGMAFGPAAGFLTGAMSGFVSNFIFGQGPWTPWQMFAFGLAGFIAGALARRGILKPIAGVPVSLERKAERGISSARTLAKIWGRLPLSVFGLLLVVILIGPILDTCTLFTMSSTVNTSSAGAIYLAGLPVNIVHGVATFLTLFFLCKPMLEKLDRIKVKYGMMEDANEV